jgi:hypothetical protein
MSVSRQRQACPLLQEKRPLLGVVAKADPKARRPRFPLPNRLESRFIPNRTAATQEHKSLPASLDQKVLVEEHHPAMPPQALGHLIGAGILVMVSKDAHSAIRWMDGLEGLTGALRLLGGMGHEITRPDQEIRWRLFHGLGPSRHGPGTCIEARMDIPNESDAVTIEGWRQVWEGKRHLGQNRRTVSLSQTPRISSEDQSQAEEPDPTSPRQ